MRLRQSCSVLLVASLFVNSFAMSAEPELKKGVRLSLGGARLQGWAAPEVVDWNGDGLNDMVVGHYSGALFVYLNRGFGKNGFVFEKADVSRRDGFGSGWQPTWAWRFNKTNCVCPGPGRVSPRVVDWDNDGKKDLVIGDGRGAQTRVWQNIGTKNSPAFSTHHIEYLPPDAGIRPYHETVQLFVADWNGDGKKDLIMGRNRGVYIYLNEGTDAAPKFDFDRSRLGTKIRGVFPSERLSPAFIDWDGDGKKDLVVGSQRGEVWFARNVGSKTQPEFKGYSLVPAGGKDIQAGSEARIAVSDLDGDGRKDLLVGAGNGVVWFFQASQPNPVARGRYARVNRGGSVPVDLVGTDDAGRALTYSVLTQPKHGTLSGTAPNLTYTPKKDYAGPDQFTFRVAAGELESAPATVTIEIQPPDKPPTITTQPVDELVAIGQSAGFTVTASGTPPISYQWTRNGEVIPRATGPSYFIRETKADESAVFSVTVKNAAGSVASRAAALRVMPLPTKRDDVPIVDIKAQSPVTEPATPGVLTITRSGNTSLPVTVKLTSRRGHDPVVADIHFVPVPSSITLKADQTTVEIPVTPIDDTLVNGTRSLTFLIVPNPAYRLASKLGAAKMTFLDDDCPQVGISVVKDAKANASGVQIFEVTALPAPRRDTEVAYFVGGTAIGSVDYEALPGTVTIPANKTSATIVINPYKQAASGEKSTEKKTVVLTLPSQPFTFFNFYRYLTHGPSRTASVQIERSDAGPSPPKEVEAIADAAVEKLRREVSRLGWVVFSARSGGPNSDLDLFVMRPDGSQLRNISNTPRFDEYGARVSPDGKRMLYRRAMTTKRGPTNLRLPQNVGNVALSTWPAQGTLVIANADGSDPKPLGSDGELAWASWGPEGQRIAHLEEVEVKNAPPNKPPSYQIVIRDAGTMKVVEEHRSRGIHSHAVWSPDGKRFCGATNMPPGKPARPAKGVEFPLGRGKIADVNLATGRITAMARFHDLTPVWSSDTNCDWFQGGSPYVLHSANHYGICPAYYSMLYRSGLEGKPSELVYGEFKKHVWGGCTSPDDRYAIFVIGGDNWPLQGKMSVIRLADAPIARGRSPLFHEVLADYSPNLRKGPVLDLHHVPEGFEPHWTRAEIGVDAGPGK